MSGLAEWADRLLVGTGLDEATARAVAAGSAVAGGVAAAAIRDGWTSADRVAAEVVSGGDER